VRDQATRSPPDPQAIQALTALMSQGQFARGEQQARAMTEQFPGHAFAWSALGACLAQMGRFGDALAPMRQAAALQPANAGLHHNLGNILNNLGRFDEAEADFRKALALKADFAPAHAGLGNALRRLRRLSEAESCFRKALALDSGSVEVLDSLGSTLNELGRPAEAEACFRRALALEPGSPGLYNNLGVSLSDQGRAAEAESCFRRALALSPDFAHAHNNLGNALRNQRRLEEAEGCFRRAIALSADFAYAYSNLGTVLIDTGRLQEAESVLRRALALQPDLVDAHSNLLFALNCRSDATPALLLDEARKYGHSVSGLVTRRYVEWHCESRPRRLRVGVVSGDLREHPVGYFLENLLREIGSESIELIAYPTRSGEDALSQRLRGRFAAWRPLAGLPDAAAAARIHADGVHILLDLSGHTEHNRLPMFAWKPAPVQASWLGYCGTTGVQEIDYVIADSWTLPPSAEVAFSEKIWRLPDTYLCFSPPDANVAVSAPPALSTGHVTFGSFNSLTKMTDEVVALWARVLAAVPGSRLFLKARQFREPAMRQGALDRYAVHGIERDRLILEDVLPTRVEHLAAHGRVDIALDPFPYSGITTSAEALWMGVPVLTLAGDRYLSRQGVGLMMNMGLPEWIASDPDDYVGRAVSHAADLQGLAALRASLRERFVTSPVCDAKRFARNFELALEGMWRTCGVFIKSHDASTQ
jgi:predicted O-linked N-acetylglucosamine transferase (SPINDLY family)